MKLSIITTIYKAERDLPRLLDSMMAQKSLELEFFLIDNGSPDRCGEICAEYARKDSRFVVCSLTDNIGYIGARNLGIERCTGDYIGFCDSDDYLVPGAYDRVVEIIHSTGCDLYITSYNTQSGAQIQICDMPFPVGVYDVNRIKTEIFPSAFGRLKNREMLSGFMWKQVFRREIIVANKVRFDEQLKPFEDQVFNIDVIPNCDLIYIDNNIIYNYVVSTTSITGQICTSIDYIASWKRIELLYLEKCKRAHEKECIVASANTALVMVYSLVLQIATTSNMSPFYCTRIFREIVNMEVLKNIVNTSDSYISLPMSFVRNALRLRLFGLLFLVIAGWVKLRTKAVE